ncbi:MAG: 4-hydroxy-3-methylbut-2-enyl diphosphate reductase [Fibrobacter sp.]|jgi:(E)-4-hydroxy-3-methyl-but-2-enyl pyrophosphate reductase|nr:4-hydroxy-3-methylbut-2-enyl diphosphate reductase [Fibrobacter sp.]
MRIIQAKTAGFCMGVKRAVDLALENAAKTEKNILTLGPLIHNSQTVEMLGQRGIKTLNTTEKLQPKSTLLIRAHGIPPQIQKKYADEGHIIIDGTCPKVKTVHKVISRYREMGYSIVITGDKGHAEVIGLLGYAGESGYLIQSIEDVQNLPSLDKICLVSQTTFDRNQFDRIAEHLKKSFPHADIIIKKTICSATDQRQSETEQLAKQVDALIVVGGKNSANTQRLAKIAQDCGTPTQHVETEEDINWDSIANCRTIGITAGASTPIWMINRVTDYIQFMNHTKKHSIPNTFWHVFDILANLNIFVSLGATAVYYASCYLQSLSFSFLGAVLIFLYFLSTYLWNSLASIETTQHHGISRYKFYCKHRSLLLSISAASIILMLALSFLHDKTLFYLLLFASLIGSTYHITIVPEYMRKLIRYRSLKDIPSSRDLFVALAWATVITFVPQILNHTWQIEPLNIATFCWIFILAFFRSLVFDLRDIEGDRIMGRETLITIIGEKRARKMTFLMICFSIAALLLFPLLINPISYRSEKTIRFLFQIPSLFYILFITKWNPQFNPNHASAFNLLADGLFFLAALGALAASAIV